MKLKLPIECYFLGLIMMMIAPGAFYAQQSGYWIGGFLLNGCIWLAYLLSCGLAYSKGRKDAAQPAAPVQEK